MSEELDNLLCRLTFEQLVELGEWLWINEFPMTAYFVRMWIKNNAE